MDFKKHLQMLKQPKVQSYILIGSSIVFICIALYLFLSRDFWYAMDNISYYNSRYEYTSSMQGGYFGSDYLYLASKWKELYNEAITYVVCHIIGAIILSTVGGIGLCKGIKNVKKLKKLSNEHDSTKI